MANEIQKQETNVTDILKMEITPAVISFPGEEELKKYLSEEIKKYSNLVITDENIKDAKKVKTYLNKMKKSLNDARIEKEREMMKPFNEFKASIDSLIKQIDQTITPIDERIKEADEAEKERKKELIKQEIKEIIDGHNIAEEEAGFFEFDAKWLNKSAKMKDIRESLVMQARKYLADKKAHEEGLKLIHNLSKTLNVTEENYINLFNEGMGIDDVLSFMKREKENQEERAEKERQRKLAEEEAKKNNAIEQEKTIVDPEFDYLAGVDLNEIKTEPKNFDFETGEILTDEIADNVSMPEIDAETQTITLNLTGTYENFERLNDIFESLDIIAEPIDLANDYVRIR